MIGYTVVMISSIFYSLEKIPVKGPLKRARRAIVHKAHTKPVLKHIIPYALAVETLFAPILLPIMIPAENMMPTGIINVRRVMFLMMC